MISGHDIGRVTKDKTKMGHCLPKMKRYERDGRITFKNSYMSRMKVMNWQELGQCSVQLKSNPRR